MPLGLHEICWDIFSLDKDAEFQSPILTGVIFFLSNCYGNDRVQYVLSQYRGCWLPGALTHWGRVMHICVSRLTITGSDNGLSPGRRQAIIWTNAGILLIWPLGTNFSEISIAIQTFSFKKIHLKMLSGKWRPFCLGLNVLTPGHHRSQLWPIPNCITGHIHLFTHCGLVMQHGVIKPHHHWFRYNGLSTF